MEELKKDQSPEMENSENKEIKKSKSLDSFKTDAIDGDAILGGGFIINGYNPDKDKHASGGGAGHSGGGG